MARIEKLSIRPRTVALRNRAVLRNRMRRKIETERILFAVHRFAQCPSRIAIKAQPCHIAFASIAEQPALPAFARISGRLSGG